MALTRRLGLTTAILLLAVAVRFWHIESQSLWFDEGIAWHVAIQPNLPAAIIADPTNPPFYFLLLYAVVHAAGDSVLAMRWFSAMVGLLLCAIGYRAASRWFGRAAGNYAALLMAVSPPLWWASQEIRMYGLMAVLVLLAALAWYACVTAPARRYWLMLWSAELLLLYTHSTGPVVVLWLNAVTLLAWLVRRSARVPDWRSWIAGQLGIGLLWSPWLLTRVSQLQASNDVVASPPLLDWHLLSQIWQSFWIGSWAMVDREPVLVLLCILLLLLSALVIPWRRAAARWLVVHILVLVAGVLAGLTYLGINLHGRYLVMAVPLLLVAVSGGLARLGNLTYRRWTGLWRYAPLCAAAPFVVTSALGIGLADNPAYQHDQVRAMVQHYAQTLNAQDTVLAWSYVDRYDLAYYWEHLGVTARRVTIPEGADLADVMPLLPSHGRVALNIWFAQRGDYRDMLDCVLSHGTASQPEAYEVYGMASRVYEAAPRAPSSVESSSGRFSVAHVTDIGVFPSFTAERAACVPVQITLDQATTHPLKAALIVRNQSGWEIARADAVFARADQKTSAQLAPGEVLTAYPLLRLPYGAPAETYTAILRIYDDDQLSGYDVLRADRSPAGKDLDIGSWLPQPGADWSQVVYPADAFTRVDMPLDHQNLVLKAYASKPAAATSVNNGSRIALTLLWQGTSSLPPLMLVPMDGQWRLTIPPSTSDRHDAITLDWREVDIPAEAGTGVAQLVLPSGQAIAEYAITALPFQHDPPAYQTSVGAQLTGIGELVGYTLPSTQADRTQPVSITLVWRAADVSPGQNYVVFVQLLGADGRLLAQSDAIPAQASRPTTGWRAQEYIVDPHQLKFRSGAPAGAARLIAGMYDAQTGKRAFYADGTDAVALPDIIEVR